MDFLANKFTSLPLKPPSYFQNNSRLSLKPPSYFSQFIRAGTQELITPTIQTRQARYIRATTADISPLTCYYQARCCCCLHQAAQDKG
jgi:hypothetical protein